MNEKVVMKFYYIFIVTDKSICAHLDSFRFLIQIFLLSRLLLSCLMALSSWKLVVCNYTASVLIQHKILRSQYMHYSQIQVIKRSKLMFIYGVEEMNVKPIDESLLRLLNNTICFGKIRYIY